jgi:hypothetical protein
VRARTMRCLRVGSRNHGKEQGVSEHVEAGGQEQKLKKVRPLDATPRLWQKGRNLEFHVLASMNHSNPPGDSGGMAESMRCPVSGPLRGVLSHLGRAHPGLQLFISA